MADNIISVVLLFKKAMDEYEEFFDEYVDFMEKYGKADSMDELSMLEEYTEYLQKYTDTMKALEAWDSSSMTTEESRNYKGKKYSFVSIGGTIDGRRKIQLYSN